MTVRVAFLAIIVISALAFSSGVAGMESAGQSAHADDEVPYMVIHIALQSNGDARWTVSAHCGLRESTENQTFEELFSECTQNQTFQPSIIRVRQAAQAAGTITGRPMRISNVTRDVTESNGIARLTLSFVWTDFSYQNGTRMRLGDVFQTESGTWLTGLSENQTLIVEFPASHRVKRSSTALEQGNLVIEGPATLSAGNPSASLEAVSGEAPRATTLRKDRAGYFPRETFVQVGLTLLAALVLLIYLFFYQEGF